MAREADDVILEALGLKKRYRESGSSPVRPRWLWAVGGVDLAIRRGETLGIVGESGCGKSTVAKLLMGLEKPTEGEIRFHGRRIDALPERRLRPLRPKFQMVFQDSGASLNPRKRVLDILADPMVRHGVVPRREAGREVERLLRQVGLTPEHALRYPHEFSGGQRQRICIARALALKPELVVLDEPVSALDVSVQAQILNLLRDLQKELELTYLFIGHGLGAVHYMSHRIAVMYMGRVVEQGEGEALFAHPAHPYTKALLDAAPLADWAQRDRPRITLRGEVGMAAAPTGCAFRDRCPWADEGCALTTPALSPAPFDPSRLAACVRAAEKEATR